MWTAKPVHLPRQWVQARQPAAGGEQCSAKQMSEAANINLRLESCPSWPSDHLCNEFFGGHKRKSCDAGRDGGRGNAAMMENRLKGGQMRWPSLLLLLRLFGWLTWRCKAALQATRRDVASVEKLQLGSQPHFKLANRCDTVAGYSVATRRQQAACNTIR